MCVYIYNLDCNYDLTCVFAQYVYAYYNVLCNAVVELRQRGT